MMKMVFSICLHLFLRCADFHLKSSRLPIFQGKGCLKFDYRPLKSSASKFALSFVHQEPFFYCEWIQK